MMRWEVNKELDDTGSNWEAICNAAVSWKGNIWPDT